MAVVEILILVFGHGVGRDRLGRGRRRDFINRI